MSVTIWGNVTGGGETLLSMATDVGSVNQVWVLVSGGGAFHVRSYDTDSTVLLTSFDIPSTGTPNDIAVDYANGLLYVAGTGDTTIRVYDLNSGSTITPSVNFDSGASTSNVGISVSGGVAYILTANGDVRMVFVDGGNFAGVFSTGIANGKAIYADFTNRRVWIVKSDGTIAIYHAYVALGTVTDSGGVTGAPGFDAISAAPYLHIVMSADHVKSPSTHAVPGSDVHYTVKHGDSLWKIAVKFYGNGSLWKTIYARNKSVIGSNPSLIFAGQVYTIPNTHTTQANDGGVRYFVTYTRGRWVQNTVPGPIGQPDQLQRVWEMDDQIAGFSYEGGHGITVADPAVVILGEEGRVCDWNPTLDGYGLLKTDQKWKTKTGHVISTGHGWYPQQWDVPDRAFEPPPVPYWPEGIAYAQDYLNHKNRELTVQRLIIVNADGIWGSMVRGGTYTVDVVHQGPRPGGITGLVVRCLKFSPNDFTGELEAVCEVYIPDIAAPTSFDVQSSGVISHGGGTGGGG